MSSDMVGFDWLHSTCRLIEAGWRVCQEGEGLIKVGGRGVYIVPQPRREYNLHIFIYIPSSICLSISAQSSRDISSL